MGATVCSVGQLSAGQAPTSVFTRIFSVRKCRVAPQWLIHGNSGLHLHGGEGDEKGLSGAIFEADIRVVRELTQRPQFHLEAVAHTV